jgi:hypothetical protein
MMMPTIIEASTGQPSFVKSHLMRSPKVLGGLPTLSIVHLAYLSLRITHFIHAVNTARKVLLVGNVPPNPGFKGGVLIWLK